MPSLEVKDCKQRAVLWALSGYGDDGQHRFSAPAEVRVRWTDKQSQVVDKDGNNVALDATVVVLQVIAIGSLMWLGTLDDWYATGSGGVGTGLMIVKTTDFSTDIKNRATRRTVGLQRYKDKPAT
jgi:hypothetical protein